MERGSFAQKLDFAFEVYDIYGEQRLDIITLRQLIIRNYSRPLTQLDEALKEVKQAPEWHLNDFMKSVLPLVRVALPQCQEKMSALREYCQRLEATSGFSLSQVE